MKVTAELKNLIKISFDEKRSKVTNEIKAVAKDLYEEKKKEVSTSKEFKAYVRACKALYERFEEDYKAQGDYYSGNTAYKMNISDLKNVKVEDIVSDNISCYSKCNNDIQTNFSKEIKALNLAQESLLIKLTYEKDLDIIRDILAECGIVI